MPKRDVRFFLQDMLEAIDKIERYTTGLTQGQFAANDMAVDAVVRNLEVIGEAAKQIPEELREKYADVEWRRVTGFRKIAIHAYFDVDVEIVWTIATSQLAGLKKALRAMLADLEPGVPGTSPTR